MNHMLITFRIRVGCLKYRIDSDQKPSRRCSQVNGRVSQLSLMCGAPSGNPLTVK